MSTPLQLQRAQPLPSSCHCMSQQLRHSSTDIPCIKQQSGILRSVLCQRQLLRCLIGGRGHHSQLCLLCLLISTCRVTGTQTTCMHLC